MVAIKDYLENEHTGPYVDYFKQLSRAYPQLKADQKKNIQFVIDFMKNQSFKNPQKKLRVFILTHIIYKTIICFYSF